MKFQTNLRVLYISPYSHIPKFFCLSPEPLLGFLHEIVISFPYPHQHSVFLSVNKNKFPSFVCVWRLTLATLEITAGHQILSTRQSLDMSKQVLWLEVPSNGELLSCEWRSPAKKGWQKKLHWPNISALVWCLIAFLVIHWLWLACHDLGMK